jgi:hypothetical protein
VRSAGLAVNPLKSIHIAPTVKIVCVLAIFAFPTFTGATQSSQGTADAWLTNTASYPPALASSVVQALAFESLQAEAIAGKLKVSWRTNLAHTAKVVLYASFDAPGHWPARDWRSRLMIARGTSWDISVPVLHLDVPMIYFVLAQSSNGFTRLSPLRICHPRLAGLEQPSRVFWPFLEGFEENLESWRLLNDQPGYVPLTTNRTAVNGYAALQVTLPPDKQSVAVATTVLRGWQIAHYEAKGLRLWVRTQAGSGSARFALIANAGATNQVIYPSPIKAKIKAEWQKIEIPFTLAPPLALHNVDLFTLEFTADGPREFLVDDLSLLGRWRLELE